MITQPLHRKHKTSIMQRQHRTRRRHHHHHHQHQHPHQQHQHQHHQLENHGGPMQHQSSSTAPTPEKTSIKPPRGFSYCRPPQQIIFTIMIIIMIIIISLFPEGNSLKQHSDTKSCKQFNNGNPILNEALNTGDFRKCGPKPVDVHSININNHNQNHYSPCNVYFGDNFSVRLYQWFKFLTCFEDIRTGGVVMCDFTPNNSLSAMTLSDDAVKIRDAPNAGGSSVGSEVLSFEVLQKCFKAKLLKTEMEVEYFPRGGSITDYVCVVFGGTKLGVSVTRARNYCDREFTTEQADHLLNKKLRGINQSSRNSLENWNKQVLFVWSANRDVTTTLVQAFHTLDPEVTSNTVVLISTTTTSCDFIYLNG